MDERQRRRGDHQGPNSFRDRQRQFGHLVEDGHQSDGRRRDQRPERRVEQVPACAEVEHREDPEKGEQRCPRDPGHPRLMGQAGQRDPRVGDTDRGNALDARDERADRPPQGGGRHDRQRRPQGYPREPRELTRRTPQRCADGDHQRRAPDEQRPGLEPPGAAALHEPHRPVQIDRVAQPAPDIPHAEDLVIATHPDAPYQIS